MLTATGRLLLEASASAGRATALFLAAGARIPSVPRTLRPLLRQIDHAGVGSLLVLSLISGLTGMIMVMQMGPTLETYGALNTLGGIIAVTFCRELGPIWAAVIILARVGSAMAAELGTMTVNEEVEALRIMDVDPVRFLVLPRILALVLVLPLLTVVANIVGIGGGGLIAKALFGLPLASFHDSAAQFLSGADFFGGLIKAAVFGGIIGTIACAQGLSAEGGAEGVGKVTTNAVRLCVIFVLIADLILTGLLRIVLPGGMAGG